MSNLRQAAEQALEALENHTAIKHPQQIHYRDAAIEALRAALKNEFEPAIHFCHRFAILMESMMLTNDVDLDRYWDEAHALMGEYHTARDKWMEEQGQPYVSGFGKD